MRYALVSSVLFMLTVLPVLASDGAIPIWEPTTITEPGKYVLTRDIRADLAGSAVVTIAVDNVDFDLNGFTVENTSPLLGIGIGISGHYTEIHNGFVMGFIGISIGSDLGDVNHVAIRQVTVSDSELGIEGCRRLPCLLRHLEIEDTHVSASQSGIAVDCAGCRTAENSAQGGGIGGNIDDTMIVANVVTTSDTGLSIAGARNHIEGNVLAANGFGLYFPSESADNTYRRNAARGNSVADFLDNGTNNTSHGDNYMPNQM